MRKFWHIRIYCDILYLTAFSARVAILTYFSKYWSFWTCKGCFGIVSSCWTTFVSGSFLSEASKGVKNVKNLYEFIKNSLGKKYHHNLGHKIFIWRSNQNRTTPSVSLDPDSSLSVEKSKIHASIRNLQLFKENENSVF